MASRVSTVVPLGEEPDDAALQQSPWRKPVRLSSVADAVEGFLARAGFDRGPWLAVALAAGIAAWFALPSPAWWVATIAGGLLVTVGALALWRGAEDRSNLIVACVGTGLLVAFGVALIWARSELVGAPSIERPGSTVIAGKVLERIEQPADGRFAILDYKTGSKRTEKQVRTGLAPQLTLEAAILRQKGFKAIPEGGSVADVVYVTLKGGSPAGEECVIPFTDGNTTDDHADRALSRLTGVIAQFENEDTPYRSLVHPMWKTSYGDYDHLARVKEWSLGGGGDDE